MGVRPCRPEARAAPPPHPLRAVVVVVDNIPLGLALVLAGIAWAVYAVVVVRTR